LLLVLGLVRLEPFAIRLERLLVPMLELPDMIRVSVASDVLILARVVLIRPVGRMPCVRPALFEAIIVAGHVALDVLALPVVLVRDPVPSV
jgi:hypothetical protein